jgi:hypothetical protein
MTRENIIRMAHEAQFEGFGNGDWVCTTEEIERFAALVEDAQAKRMHDEGFVTVGHMRQQIAAQRQPLTDEQIDAGVAAWFATETVVGGRPFEKRMRAAIEAAHGITGEKPDAA